MKLLLDMNISPLWLAAFQEAGLKAVHWSSVGSANSADEQIMQHARSYGMVVFTQDLDFGIVLAFSGENLPSVVQIRLADVLPSGTGPRVIDALKQMAPELEAGALVTIDPKRTRVRVLPLR